MNNIKIIPVFAARERPRPTFREFFLALFVMFTRLEKKQRFHVGVALLTLSIPLGLLSFMAIDKVVTTADALPKPVQSVVSPLSLALPLPEPTPTIFPEESEEVPLDSEYTPEEEDELVIPKPAPKKPKNDAAPRGVREIIPQSASAYIAMYKDAAIKSMHKYKVPASITLAQGLIEGNAGKSTLARTANNHFGIKCFSKNCRKGHCVNATDDSHKDFFRKYTSVLECFNDHGQKISSGRYKGLLRYGKDYRKWAYGLKSKGYATDRTYAEKLIGMIKRYGLDKYDH